MSLLGGVRLTVIGRNPLLVYREGKEDREQELQQGESADLQAGDQFTCVAEQYRMEIVEVKESKEKEKVVKTEEKKSIKKESEEESESQSSQPRGAKRKLPFGSRDTAPPSKRAKQPERSGQRAGGGSQKKAPSRKRAREVDSYEESDDFVVKGAAEDEESREALEVDTRAILPMGSRRSATRKKVNYRVDEDDEVEENPAKKMKQVKESPKARNVVPVEDSIEVIDVEDNSSAKNDDDDKNEKKSGDVNKMSEDEIQKSAKSKADKGKEAEEFPFIDWDKEYEKELQEKYKKKKPKVERSESGDEGDEFVGEGEDDYESDAEMEGISEHGEESSDADVVHDVDLGSEEIYADEDEESDSLVSRKKGSASYQPDKKKPNISKISQKYAYKKAENKRDDGGATQSGWLQKGGGAKPVCSYGRSCYRKNPSHFGTNCRDILVCFMA